MKRRNVGILIFPDVEVLDFAGPFEVFSRTRLEPGIESRRTSDSAPFEVFTFAKSTDEVRATGGLRVVPSYAFENVPGLDLMVVPGGFGTRPLLEDEQTLQFLKTRSAQAEQVTSVCTGALLLAKIGLLRDRRATTHWGALDLLQEIGGASLLIDRDGRLVDDGVISSAGVAAGIDMALYVVEKLFGRPVAEDTARYMDYPLMPRS